VTAPSTTIRSLSSAFIATTASTSPGGTAIDIVQGPVAIRSCLSRRWSRRSGKVSAKTLRSVEFRDPTEPLGKPYSS